MQETVAVISLKKIRRNAERIKEQTSSPLIAVVKDDGYGHGAVEVAHALKGTVSAFAVATISEGVALRVAGVAEEILVFTPPISEADVLAGARYRLTLTLSSPSVLNVTVRATEKYHLSVSAHFAVNTGMNRYGFRPERIKSALKEAECLAVTGVYSHFYAPFSEQARKEQMQLFLPAADLVKDRFPHAVRHISATGGILADPTCALDGVRSGIALYGYLPSGGRKIFLERAMKVYATVSHRATYLGNGAGYGEYRLAQTKGITVRAGYGDGFFRTGGLNAIGALCMDAYLTAGDCPFGRRKLIFSDASAYAEACGTIAYEVLCSVGRRSVRVYDER